MIFGLLLKVRHLNRENQLIIDRQKYPSIGYNTNPQGAIPYFTVIAYFTKVR